MREKKSDQKGKRLESKENDDKDDDEDDKDA